MPDHSSPGHHICESSISTMAADHLEPLFVVDRRVVPEIRAPGDVVPTIQPKFSTGQRSL
jgi:hypothetical protein